jgi:hypothetical protein
MNIFELSSCVRLVLVQRVSSLPHSVSKCYTTFVEMVRGSS